MPLSRHAVGNEYALGGRDLYRAADQHDPEAVLDGVAMAGLVLTSLRAGRDLHCQGNQRLDWIGLDWIDCQKQAVITISLS